MAEVNLYILVQLGRAWPVNLCGCSVVVSGRLLRSSTTRVDFSTASSRVLHNHHPMRGLDFHGSLPTSLPKVFPNSPKMYCAGTPRVKLLAAGSPRIALQNVATTLPHLRTDSWSTL